MAVRMDAVVLLAPVLDDDPCLGEGEEPFLVQALVTEAVMEALHMTILPGAPWFDIEGFDLVLLQIFLGRRGDELRAGERQLKIPIG